MLFREYRVTYESRQEPLDGIGCFPVPACTQVIGEILKSLLIAIYFLLNSTPLSGLIRKSVIWIGFPHLTDPILLAAPAHTCSS